MIDPGGFTQFYDYSLSKELSKKNCEIELVISATLDEPLPDNKNFKVKYHFYKIFESGFLRSTLENKAAFIRMTLKGIEHPIDLFLLMRYIRQFKPDVIHFQWTPIPVMDSVFLTLLKKMGYKIVYTAHEVLPFRTKIWDRVIFRIIYKMADKIIIHLSMFRKDLIQQFGVKDKNIVVACEGNRDDFIGEGITKNKAKESISLNGKQPVILFFGAIKPYKGLKNLILAFPKIKSKFPDAKLLIAGRLHLNFSPFRNLIRELDLSNKVITDLRFVPTERVKVYFSAADLVVLPYVKAYNSGVLIQAYSFGKPVVTSNIGCFPDMVEDGKSGYLVPPADIDKLAETISNILSHEVKLTQMGSYARHLAETKYSWKKTAETTFKVYESLCKRTGLNH